MSSSIGNVLRADRFTARRWRRVKPDAEIVVVCNPRAGGRWKELAAILDSEEAQYARRIVTDSVEDIANALDDLGRDTKLLCVYGGDGTVQRVLDRLTPATEKQLQLAIIGGGTMNVTSRWAGFSRDPGRNFRYVVQSFRRGDLLVRETPVLDISVGDALHRGFTFGMGPVVRLLDAYERGKKGKLPALGMAAKAVSAALLRWPNDARPLLDQMDARIELDGEPLAANQFAAVFANVTGQINPGVEPFSGNLTRGNFHCAAYAVSAREMSLALPMLVRGWLPKSLDLSGLLRRTGRLPRITDDPRYVNRTASELVIESPETMYTIDGEILEAPPGRIRVALGPTLKLAVGPRFGLRMAARELRPER